MSRSDPVPLETSFTEPADAATGAGRRGPRWERRKASRPSELLQAALEVFVERGFSSARLDDVASRAGVSKGTLYLYFDNKEEIFTELCLRSAKAIKTILAGAEDLPDPLAALYETCRRLSLTSIYNYKAGTLPLLSAGLLSPAARASIRKEGTAFTAALESIIARAVREKVSHCKDPKLAALLIGGIASSIYRWYSPKSKLPPQELAHEIACSMVAVACANVPFAIARPNRTNSDSLLLEEEPWAGAYWWLVENT